MVQLHQIPFFNLQIFVMKNILFSLLIVIAVGFSSSAQQTHFSISQTDSMRQVANNKKNAGVTMTVLGGGLIVGGAVCLLKALEISLDESWEGKESGEEGVFAAMSIVGYGAGIPLLITGIRKLTQSHKINKMLQNADISMSTRPVPYTTGGGLIHSIPQTSVSLTIPF